jgi:acetyltransferase
MEGAMAAGAQPALSVKTARDPLDERVRSRTASLDCFFNPGSVAVIANGGTPDPSACTILSTISKCGFTRKLFAVGLDQVAAGLGVQSYPSVKAIPFEVDLAVVTAPPDRLLEMLGQCVTAGVKGAVVTASCRQLEGSQGDLYSRVQLVLRGSRMRVLGPNCSILMNPSIGLNTSCGGPLAVGGPIAFLSQSGAVCRAALEWSFLGIVGLSAMLATSGMIDVDWGDLLDYFGADPNTRSIVIFMESIGNARSLLSAAREVALNKPIIVVKAGRSDTAARITAADTGSPRCNDEVLDAALRRVGVLRVNTVAELFSMADVLSKEPPPQGPRLGIVSNAAGLSALAADSVAGAGGQFPALSEQSCEELVRLLQSPWRAENPVHIPPDAPPETYAKAARILLHDPNCDGLLLLTGPEGMSHPEEPAQLLVNIENRGQKPILACVMGTPDAAEPEQAVARACIPTFGNPHLAARAFGYMWQYARNLRAIYEMPMRRGDPVENLAREMAAHIIVTARGSGRTELTESETRFLLGAYGIHTLETRTAADEDNAVREATDLGFPVALEMVKAVPPSDAVPLFRLPDGESVRRAWRFLEEFEGRPRLSVKLHLCVAANGCALHIASWVDPEFGPVLLFGPGGPLADALGDRALALPPLNATLAERMVEETQIYRALKAGCHGPSDVAPLLNLLVRFSQLVTEQPWIKEVDINPLLLSQGECVGVNARVAIHGTDLSEKDLSRPAIRPYPVQYVSNWQTKRGDMVTIRPILAEDEPLMIRFHQSLSDHSVYLRYFQMIGLSQRTQHDRLTRICFIDYAREMALVVERRDPQTEERRIVGLGNLSCVRGRNEGEVAVVVSDDYQGHGLGTELMRRLVAVARAEKLERVLGCTMTENTPTIALLKRVGFQLKVDYEDHVVEGEMNL